MNASLIQHDKINFIHVTSSTPVVSWTTLRLHHMQPAQGQVRQAAAVPGVHQIWTPLPIPVVAASATKEEEDVSGDCRGCWK